MGLRIGVARGVLTPPRGSYLIGYGDRLLGARGVRDPLFATALVADDGAGGRLALVSLDLLCLHEDVVARIRAGITTATGIPGEAVLLACSHTHAGPIGWTGPRSTPWRRRAMAHRVAAVVDAVARAARDTAPATLHRGRGESGVAINRREAQADGRIEIGENPEGFVDRDLDVLQLRTDDGRVGATVVFFACHPAVLSPRNRRVTAEWPGVMRSRVENATGAPCLFVQGATGNLNPRHGWGDDDLEAMERIGDEVADGVLAVLRDGLAETPAVPLAAACTEVGLPIVLRRTERGRVEPWYRTGARKLGVPSPLIALLVRYAYPWRPRHVARGDDAEMPLALQALRLGDVGITALGAETFAEIGAELKAKGIAPTTLFAGYANGMIGYLPTAQAHAEGGYEVDEAPLAYRMSGTFAPEAADHATRASLELLAGLYRV